MASKKEATLLLKIKETGSQVFSSISKGFFAITKAAAITVAAIVAIGAAITKIGLRAEVVKEIEKAFTNLAAAQGKNSKEILESMKKATAGAISELELMKNANQALLLGLPIERFDDMLKIARSASKATGESMEFMLNSIVVGLGRGSKLVLDNLGIVFKLEDAYKEFAKANGILAKDLTEVQKKQAFLNKALETGLENAKNLGEMTVTLKDRYMKVKATMSNLYDEVSFKLTPAFELLIGVLEINLKQFGDMSRTETFLKSMKNINIAIVELVGAMKVLFSGFQSFIGSLFSKDLLLGPVALSKALAEGAIAGFNKSKEVRQKTAKQIDEINKKFLEMDVKRRLDANEEILFSEIEIADKILLEHERVEESINRGKLNKRKIALAEIEAVEIEAIKKTQEIVTSQFQKNQNALHEMKAFEIKLEEEKQTKLATIIQGAQAETNAFLAGGFKGLMTSAVSTMVDIAIPGFGTAAGQLFEILSQDTEEFEKTLEQLFSGDFLDNMAANIETFFDRAPELMEKIVAKIAENAPEIAIALGKAFSDPEFQVALVKGVTKGFVDGIAQALRDMADEIAKVFTISLPSIGGGGGDDDDGAWYDPRTYLADGGIVKATPGGTPAVIAEGGEDEIVAPLSKLSQIMNMSNNISIVVQGGLLGDESSARELAIAIDNELLKLRQNNESVSFDQGVT